MPQTSAIDKVFERTRVPLTLVDAHDEEFALLRVSDSFCEMSGYDRADCIGRNCRFLQGEDVQQPGRFVLREALQAGADVQVILRNYTRAGKAFDNLIFVHHIRDLYGKVVYVMGSQFVIRDRESADSLDRHLNALNQGITVLAKTDQTVQINVKRQISASTSAMLHSAVLQDRLAVLAGR